MSSHFSIQAVKGNVAKELVRSLLEANGYSVYPFGYESYITPVKNMVQRGELERNQSLSSMPDLVVVDDEGNLDLVEVKYRNSRPRSLQIDGRTIAPYFKNWKDLKLVFVLPYELVFYTIHLIYNDSNESIVIMNGDAKVHSRLNDIRNGIQYTGHEVFLEDFSIFGKELRGPYTLETSDGKKSTINFELTDKDGIETYFKIDKNSTLDDLRELTKELYSGVNY